MVAGPLLGRPKLTLESVSELLEDNVEKVLMVEVELSTLSSFLLRLGSLMIRRLGLGGGRSATSIGFTRLMIFSEV